MGCFAEFGGVWRYVSDSIKDPLETFRTETVQFSNAIAGRFDDAEATIVRSDRLRKVAIAVTVATRERKKVST